MRTVVRVASCFVLIAALAGLGGARPRTRTVRCYSLRDELAAERARRPSATPAELAELGNGLIRERGMPFEFDFSRVGVGPDEPGANGRVPVRPHAARLVAAGGARVSLRVVGAVDEGACGEAFLSLPVRRVRGDVATVLTDAGPLDLLAPSSKLGFETMDLVDASLRKTVRRWAVPYQTVPLGVSADGRELYVGLNADLGLALGIGPSGYRLVPRSEIGPEPEDVEGPKDPKNAYLSYARVRAGARTYYVRYSAPCT